MKYRDTRPMFRTGIGLLTASFVIQLLFLILIYANSLFALSRSPSSFSWLSSLGDFTVFVAYIDGVSCFGQFFLIRLFRRQFSGAGKDLFSFLAFLGSLIYENLGFFTAIYHGYPLSGNDILLFVLNGVLPFMTMIALLRDSRRLGIICGLFWLTGAAYNVFVLSRLFGLISTPVALAILVSDVFANIGAALCLFSFHQEASKQFSEDPESLPDSDSMKGGINMSKIHYEGSEQFRPLSSWAYLGYAILFAVPVLGLILLLAFSLSSSNINRRNYARSYFCALLILVLSLTSLCVLNTDFRNSLKQTVPVLTNVIESMESLASRDTRTSSDRTLESLQALPEATAAPTATKAAPTATKNERSASIVSATATPKKAKATATPKATKKPKATATPKSTGIRKSVKKAIDTYVEFFEEYVKFMKSYSTSSNPLGMLTQYTNMLTKYAENMEAWESFEEDNDDLNSAELKYYNDANIKILKLLNSLY